MRIVGNLDVEVAWARIDAAVRSSRGEPAPSPDDPRFALPEPVMRKISAAATLLRVYADGDDDVLWTPRPVEPSRLAHIGWLAAPRLESGPWPKAGDVWWGEATETSARVNDRTLMMPDLRRAGDEAEGQAVVRTIDEVAARAEKTPRWVAKAPHSAAGRSRVRGRAGALDDAARAQAERLLELHGRLLFEPWHERSQDFGVTGDVDGLQMCVGAPHVLHVDPEGRFLGIATPAPRIPGDARVASRAALSAAELLMMCGYVGPFGVDLFVVPRPDGSRRLHLSELNARRTFGHVAHDLAKRAREALSLPGDAVVTVRFGRDVPPTASIPLLLPSADDDTAAWLECPESGMGFETR